MDFIPKQKDRPSVYMEKMNGQRRTYNRLEILSAIQGLYYVITGVWPILHMQSFLDVTGPKVDLWLVETVGILVLVIGLELITAAQRNQINFPLSIIASGSAFGLICIDVIYVWKVLISPVYLLDAVLEVIPFVAWMLYIQQTALWKK